MLRLGILAADEICRDESILAELGRGYELEHQGDWKLWDAATLLSRCRGVDVVLTGRSSPKLPAALAEDFGRLKYLCHAHGTVRHLVDKALIEKGLVVTNWGDSQSNVAEGAMTLLLAALKQLPMLDRFSKTGVDGRMYQSYPCGLRHNDVGLYGYGPIGRHMGRMLQAFEAKVAIYDPYASDVPQEVRRCGTLEELFSTCAMVSIHCGLNDATKNSVTGMLLDLLPQGGIVINTARGDIVDEGALAERVAAGRLLAGIDVIHNEKDFASSPLARCDGAILTRHSVGSGKGYAPGEKPRPRLAQWVRTNLAAFREGRPLVNVISAAEYDLKT